MVAPIHATATVKAGDETFTLRLDFAAISLVEEQGIDLFNPSSLNGLTTLGTANLFRCLASGNHPDMTPETALAVTIRYGKECGEAFGTLMKRAAGKGGDEGNAESGSEPTA